MREAQDLMRLERATRSDGDALIDLEISVFEPHRRDSAATIRRSLLHPRHEVWLLRPEMETGSIAGCLVLRLWPKALRIYSLAVAPAFQKHGAGRQLLDLAKERAQYHRRPRIFLEVECTRKDLLAWYTRHGFRTFRNLPDYYGSGLHGVRLVRIEDSFSSEHAPP